MERIASFREPRPRYRSLRVIGFLCTLAGSILLAIGVCLLMYGLYALAVGGTTAPLRNPTPIAGTQAVFHPSPLIAGISFLWSLGILLSGLQMIALGGFVRLMIHLEENTRVSAQVLDRLRSRLDASPDDVTPLFRS